MAEPTGPTASQCGIPTQILETWSQEIANADKFQPYGPSFAQLVCHSDLGTASFILAELCKLAAAARVLDDREPSVYYVLPGANCADIAQKYFLEVAVRGGIATTGLENYASYMNYADLPDMLDSMNTSQPLLLVLDTNRGRISRSFVLVMGTLFSKLLDFQRQNIPHSITVATLSPFESPQAAEWSHDSIQRQFGQEVHIATLTQQISAALPPTLNFSRPKGRSLDGHSLSLVGRCLFSDADFEDWDKGEENFSFSPRVVICMVPALIGARLENTIWESGFFYHEGNWPFEIESMTFGLFGLSADTEDIKTVQQDLGSSDKVVLFVDPSVRFIPPFPRHQLFHATPDTHTSSAEVNGMIQLCASSPIPATPLILAVQDPDMSLPTARIISPVEGELSETVCCLYQRIPRNASSILDIVLPSLSRYHTHEIFRRLGRLALIAKARDPGRQLSRFGPVTEGLARDSENARLAAEFLTSGKAKSVGEASLLVSLKRSRSPKIQYALASLLAALRVGDRGMVSLGSREQRLPGLTEFCVACAGPGRQFAMMGRLWVLAGLAAGDPSELYFDAKVDGRLRTLVTSTLRGILSDVDFQGPMDPKKLECEEPEMFLALKMLVRSFPNNLAIIRWRKGAEYTPSFLDIATGRDFDIYRPAFPGNWGPDFPIIGMEFMLHFGLRHHDGHQLEDNISGLKLYARDVIHLPTEAVRLALDELFPDIPGQLSLQLATLGCL
ncbi:hypothetical protein B0H67DRAFT_660468 [Lasiosphaeris hirsuta]|uniref:Uncharacterized protein n=1 Tax=Lasiosphaeris hirsuta TaxID=260670 RepID=A0AA40DWN8_9PEZI|nr:hypothetical protein B0H67DRAFT_660468 [Lasiosphaeris hirsuta]